MGPNEWTIIAIFGFTQVLSFIWIVSAIRGDNKVLQAQMKDVRQELKQIGTVLIELAVQKTRMDTLSDRVQLLDQRYEELRHGEGFVHPFTYPKDR